VTSEKPAKPFFVKNLMPLAIKQIKY